MVGLSEHGWIGDSRLEIRERAADLFCRRRRQRKIGALRRLIRGWRYARAASQTISLGRRALGHSERSLCVGNVLLRLVVGLARIALALHARLQSSGGAHTRIS